MCEKERLKDPCEVWGLTKGNHRGSISGERQSVVSGGTGGCRGSGGPGWGQGEQAGLQVGVGGVITNRMRQPRDTPRALARCHIRSGKWGRGVKEAKEEGPGEEEEGHGEDAGPRSQVWTERRTRAAARSRNTTSSNRDKEAVTEKGVQEQVPQVRTECLMGDSCEETGARGARRTSEPGYCGGTQSPQSEDEPQSKGGASVRERQNTGWEEPSRSRPRWGHDQLWQGRWGYLGVPRPSGLGL